MMKDRPVIKAMFFAILVMMSGYPPGSSGGQVEPVAGVTPADISFETTSPYFNHTLPWCRQTFRFDGGMRPPPRTVFGTMVV
jgi:hypothetical protein